MKFNIHGKKLEVTDSIKTYIEEKLGKLDKYFENPDNITSTVLIKLRGKDQVVEATINANKFILRGEESHSDLYAAIDKVSDIIERQIRKNKTKLKKRHKEVPTEFILDFEVEEQENKSEIVKRKTIDSKPMSEEEAILQMELLGHDFFAFKNANTGDTEILHKRKEGDYGILEVK